MDIYLCLHAKNREKVEDYAEELLTVQEENKVVQLYSVKVIDDIELSAGLGENIYDEADVVEVFSDTNYQYDIATWIKGDSMKPVYLNGEVALIQEGVFDYDGAVYAVVWNERAYIKKVYLEENGYRLVSLNSDYLDMFASAEDNPRIVGKTIGHFMPIIGYEGFKMKLKDIFELQTYGYDENMIVEIFDMENFEEAMLANRFSEVLLPKDENSEIYMLF